jgi:phosphoribosylformimino-5-aminoimidazole carboxamide ribotide isomerase
LASTPGNIRQTAPRLAPFCQIAATEKLDRLAKRPYARRVFRPCIDLHEGRVKQIVGSSIDDARPGALRTNFVSEKPPAWYAELYCRNNLRGGHVIKLGQGNDDAAREALATWPGGLQVGGGITANNAAEWIDAGASHVIVTSWLFRDGKLDEDRLKQLGQAVGQARLVLDLSCRRRGDEHFVVTDRWQTFTELRVNADTLGGLGKRCDEFLIHGVDVEGLAQGIDETLVRLIAGHSPIPATYAGGARSMDDLRRVTELGQRRVHLTIGSALDIFGGDGVRYEDAVAFNQEQTDS